MARNKPNNFQLTKMIDLVTGASNSLCKAIKTQTGAACDQDGFFHELQALVMKYGRGDNNNAVAAKTVTASVTKPKYNLSADLIALAHIALSQDKNRAKAEDLIKMSLDADGISELASGLYAMNKAASEDDISDDSSDEGDDWDSDSDDDTSDEGDTDDDMSDDSEDDLPTNDDARADGTSDDETTSDEEGDDSEDTDDADSEEEEDSDDDMSDDSSDDEDDTDDTGDTDDSEDEEDDYEGDGEEEVSSLNKKLRSKELSTSKNLTREQRVLANRISLSGDKKTRELAAILLKKAI